MAAAQGLFLTHEHTLAVSPNIQTLARALSPPLAFRFRKWNMGKRDQRARRGERSLRLLHTI